MPYLCGAARNDITPPETLFDKMRNLSGCCFSSLLHRLYARVIAIQNGEQKCLLVAFDLDKAPNPQTGIDELSRRTGVPKENIIYLGIHTHSAPVIGERPNENRPFMKDPELKTAIKEYESFVMETVYRTATEAMNDLRPARIGYGTGKSYINVNRADVFYMQGQNEEEIPCIGCGTNGNRPVDNGVYVLKAEGLDGTPIAFFVNYAIHCSILFKKFPSDDGEMMSGDLGGAVSQMLEDHFQGAVAIWSSGAAGDVNAVVRGYPHYVNPQTGGIEYCEEADNNTALTVFKHLSTRNFADTLHTIHKIKTYAETGDIRGTVQWLTVPKTSNTDWIIRMHLLRIGGIAMMGIGGELYTELNFTIKKAAAIKNTMVVTHEASLINDAGYILDDETILAVQKAPDKSIAGSLPGGNNAPTDAVVGVLAPAFEEITDQMFNAVL